MVLILQWYLKKYYVFTHVNYESYSIYMYVCIYKHIMIITKKSEMNHTLFYLKSTCLLVQFSYIDRQTHYTRLDGMH